MKHGEEGLPLHAGVTARCVQGTPSGCVCKRATGERCYGWLLGVWAPRGLKGVPSKVANDQTDTWSRSLPAVQGMTREDRTGVAGILECG